MTSKITGLTGYNDDVLGIDHHLDSLVHVGLRVCACDLHGLAGASGGRAEAA